MRRQIANQKDADRRQLIADCVYTYIKNNPNEYEIFLNETAKKRANLIDEKFGTLKNESKEEKFRLAFSMPEKLYKTVETIMELQKRERFGEVSGELKWFSTEFPQFLIPRSY